MDKVTTVNRVWVFLRQMPDDRQAVIRHPVLLCLLVGLVVIAASQMKEGPLGSPVALAMPGWSQFLFAAVVFVSAVAALASAVIPGRRGTCVELAGMIGLAVALTVYALNIPDGVPSVTTSMGLAFGGAALGAAIQAGLLIDRLR